MRAAPGARAHAGVGRTRMSRGAALPAAGCSCGPATGRRSTPTQPRCSSPSATIAAKTIYPNARTLRARAQSNCKSAGMLLVLVLLVLLWGASYTGGIERVRGARGGQDGAGRADGASLRNAAAILSCAWGDVGC